jgi:hypothetical protein
MLKTAALLYESVLKSEGARNACYEALDHKLDAEIRYLMRERNLLQQQIMRSKSLIEQLLINDDLKKIL